MRSHAATVDTTCLYAGFIRATVLPYGPLTAPHPILSSDANDVSAACRFSSPAEGGGRRSRPLIRKRLP
jgi:hypothetical protein